MKNVTQKTDACIFVVLKEKQKDQTKAAAILFEKLEEQYDKKFSALQEEKPPVTEASSEEESDKRQKTPGNQELLNCFFLFR